MKFFDKKFKLNGPGQIFKLVGLVLLIGVALIFIINFVLSPLVSMLEQSGMNTSGPFGSSTKMAYDMDEAMVSREMYPGEMGGGVMDGMANRPAIAPSPMPPSDPNVTMGDDAEDFEVTEYNVSIETRNLKSDCTMITDLKAKDYVIFESASEYDRGCSYNFKVKNANADEVLAIIEELDPKNFSENTYTIKKVLDEYESQSEILEKKIASVSKTLEDAIAAYDDIAKFATNNQDSESLTTIINSKIMMIERLTQERINANEQLDRLAKAKVEQMDRLLYTNFYLSITESKYVDVKSIKESWQAAVKTFVNDLNRTAQDMTLQLLVFVLMAFQYALYLGVLLLVAKYAWQFGKYVWKK